MRSLGAAQHEVKGGAAGARRGQRRYSGIRMPRATVETVDHVARLAHLSLKAEERETFARQLERILEYAESILALDTSGVPPMSHARASGSFRADRVEPSLARERVLEAAPDAEDGLFRVPRILGG